MSLLLTNTYFGGNNRKLIETIRLPLPREMAIYSAAMNQSGIRHTLYDTLLVDWVSFKQYLFTQRFERICLFLPKGTVEMAVEMIRYVRAEEELKNTSFVVMGPGAVGYEDDLFDASVSVILYESNEHTLVSLIQILQTPFNPFLDQAKGIKFRNILGKMITQPVGERVMRDYPPDFQGISIKKYLKGSLDYLIHISGPQVLLATSPEEALIEKHYVEKVLGLNAWISIEDTNDFLSRLSYVPATHAQIFSHIMLRVDDKPNLSPLAKINCTALALRCNVNRFFEMLSELGYLSESIQMFSASTTTLRFMPEIAYEWPASITLKTLYGFCKQHPEISIQLVSSEQCLAELWETSDRNTLKKYLRLSRKIEKMNQYIQTLQLIASENSKWKWIKPSYYMAHIRGFYQSLTTS